MELFNMTKLLVVNNANVYIANNSGVYPVDLLKSEYIKSILERARKVIIVLIRCSYTL